MIKPITLLIAIGSLVCADCSKSADNDSILYLYGGQDAATTKLIDNEAILFVYGGEKAHQYKVTHAGDNSMNYDDTITYLYSGSVAEDGDLDEIAAFLLGGDHATINQPRPYKNTENIVLFLYGSTAAPTPPALPTGTSMLKDDVALVELSQSLIELTEWSPTPTYAEGKWMLGDDTDIADADLLLFLLGGGNAPVDDLLQTSDLLFGGSGHAAKLTTVQRMHDVDVVEHSKTVHRGAPFIDMVELLERAEQADTDLAKFVLGGDAATADTSDEELAAFLFGNGADEQLYDAEKTLVHLFEQHDSISTPDMVTIIERAENADALYLLGGNPERFEEKSSATQEGWVSLIDRVEADDSTLATMLLGGNKKPIALGSGPSTMEEDDSTIAFLYDSTGAGTIASIGKFLYGGQEAVDEDYDVVKYVYGITEDQATVATVATNTDYGFSDNSMVQFMYGADSEGPSAEDETILFLFGETPSTELATPRSAPTAMTKLSRQVDLLPIAYKGDENEDCSDHECISRTLREMQLQLGLSDEHLEEDAMIWGEDMVKYCQWQARPKLSGNKVGENCDDLKAPCPTSRMPALPSSYSMLRAPSIATCKQVLKPASHLLNSSPSQF